MGLCGFTTQDLKRSHIMAKITALIYNWWTLFTRLIDPSKHMEAITSRPSLLYAVGKKNRTCQPNTNNYWQCTWKGKANKFDVSTF